MPVLFVFGGGVGVGLWGDGAGGVGRVCAGVLYCGIELRGEERECARADSILAVFVFAGAGIFGVAGEQGIVSTDQLIVQPGVADLGGASFKFHVLDGCQKHFEDGFGIAGGDRFGGFAGGAGRGAGDRARVHAFVRGDALVSAVCAGDMNSGQIRFTIERV